MEYLETNLHQISASLGEVRESVVPSIGYCYFHADQIWFAVVSFVAVADNSNIYVTVSRPIIPRPSVGARNLRDSKYILLKL